MTPTNQTVARSAAISPSKATPLQVLLAVANAVDDLALDFLSHRELAAYVNIRLRQTAIRESELEDRRRAA